MPTRDHAAAVEHIGYEVERCAIGARLTFFTQSDPRFPNDFRQVLHVTAFESCLTHARTLTEFLIPESRQGDRTRDVTSVELLPGWGCPPGAERDLLTGSLAELDRHLAHLSWDRVENPPPPRRYVDVTRAAVTLTRSFADAVTAAGLTYAAELDRRVSVAEAELAALDFAITQQKYPEDYATTSGATAVITAGTVVPAHTASTVIVTSTSSSE
jgi:hypothetical protein